MNIYDLLKAEQSLIGKRSLFSDVEQLTSLYQKRARPTSITCISKKEKPDQVSKVKGIGTNKTSILIHDIEQMKSCSCGTMN